MKKNTNMIQCEVNPAHWYPSHLKKCPHCNNETRSTKGPITFEPAKSPDDILGTTEVPNVDNAPQEQENGDNQYYEGTIVDGVGKEEENQSYGKKIVGWIISYNYDPNGMDFRVHEGANEFGSREDLKNYIPGDKKISGLHFSILYHREEGFTLVDEKSTNGLILNGKRISNRNPRVELEDRSVFKAGDTIFYFRSSIPNN